MNAQERIALSQILHQNAIDYWYDVDHNWGRNVARFFVDDAVFDGMQGIEAIKKFYAWREGRGARVARHLIANFHAEILSPTEVKTTYILTIYAHDGVAPMPMVEPMVISDQVDHCVLCPDGVWRYKSRDLRGLFKSEYPATKPPANLLAKA